MLYLLLWLKNSSRPSLFCDVLHNQKRCLIRRLIHLFVGCTPSCVANGVKALDNLQLASFLIHVFPIAERGDTCEFGISLISKLTQHCFTVLG